MMNVVHALTVRLPKGRMITGVCVKMIDSLYRGQCINFMYIYDVISMIRAEPFLSGITQGNSSY